MTASSSARIYTPSSTGSPPRPANGGRRMRDVRHSCRTARGVPVGPQRGGDHFEQTIWPRGSPTTHRRESPPKDGWTAPSCGSRCDSNGSVGGVPFPAGLRDCRRVTVEQAPIASERDRGRSRESRVQDKSRVRRSPSADRARLQRAERDHETYSEDPSGSVARDGLDVRCVGWASHPHAATRHDRRSRRHEHRRELVATAKVLRH